MAVVNRAGWPSEDCLLVCCCCSVSLPLKSDADEVIASPAEVLRGAGIGEPCCDVVGDEVTLVVGEDGVEIEVIFNLLLLWPLLEDEDNSLPGGRTFKIPTGAGLVEGCGLGFVTVEAIGDEVLGAVPTLAFDVADEG